MSTLLAAASASLPSPPQETVSLTPWFFEKLVIVFEKRCFMHIITADVIFVCNARKAIIIYPLYLYSIIPYKREL